MLILPHGLEGHRYHFLLPQGRDAWRAPSRRIMPFEDEDQRRFRFTARLSDGAVRWRGWFDDREDADAFLWAFARHAQFGEPIPREIQRLPTPAWHPGLGEYPLVYLFDTVDFLTSTSASDQTYNVPNDWANNDNSVEIIGHGGKGGRGSTTNSTAGRGGAGSGGAYAKEVQIQLTPSGTIKYRLRTSASGTGDDNGSWFGTDSGFYANAPVAARGGGDGSNGVNGVGSPGAQALASDCIGSTRFNSSGNLYSGGGGAGGPGGAGVDRDGGSGLEGLDAGGGLGGLAPASWAASSTGGDGTEWGTWGSGSGGWAGTGNTGRQGGNKGGGGGGGHFSGSNDGRNGGGGRPAIIVVTYGLIPPAGILLAF